MTTPAPGDAPTASGRPLLTIMLQPRFIIAVTAGVVSYGLMAFLMTAAPLAMVECGLPLETAALGISWHILAMFAPSFFTGKLIDRYGKETITAIGLVMIAVSAVIGLSGLTVAHFWTALILLGVGWNFGFIGATALVTDTYRPEERTKAQAANDFIVFGSVAVASFSSGQLLDAGGWGDRQLALLPAARRGAGSGRRAGANAPSRAGLSNKWHAALHKHATFCINDVCR